MTDPTNAEGFTFYLLEEVLSRSESESMIDSVQHRMLHIVKTNEGRPGLVAWMLARPDQVGAGFLVQRALSYPGAIMEFRRTATGLEENLVFYARAMDADEERVKDLLKAKLEEVRGILITANKAVLGGN